MSITIPAGQTPVHPLVTASYKKIFSLFPDHPEIESLSDLYHRYKAVFFSSIGLRGKWDPARPDDALKKMKVYLTQLAPEHMSVTDQEQRKKILWYLYQDIFTWILWLDHTMSIQDRSMWAHTYLLELQSIRWFATIHPDDGQLKRNENMLSLVEVWSRIINDDGKEFPEWKGWVIKWIDYNIRDQSYKREGWDTVSLYARYRSSSPRILPFNPALSRFGS